MLHTLEVSMRKSYLYCLGLVTLLAVGNVGQAQDSLGMRCVSNLDYWSDVYDLQMVDNLAFLSSGYSGLRIMDLSDPVNPVEIGRSPWSPWDYLINIGVYVKDSLVYLTYGNEGRVLDVSDPTHPTEIHHWYLDYTPIITFVHGNLAVGLDQETYLHPSLIDVSNWNNIQVTSNLLYANSSWPVGMVDNYLCLAGNGVELYDISDPWNPVVVGSLYDTASYWWSAKLLDDYVYISTVWNGVYIYDVSDPLNPRHVASCDSGTCYGITITDSHLFVIKSNWGIDIWDISDPLHPVFTSTYLLPVSPGGCIVNSGNFLCTALYHSEDQSVAVLDISNPASLMEISRFGRDGDLRRVIVSGWNGYLSDANIALHVTDLAELPGVSELGRSSDNGTFMDLAVQGNYAYAVDLNRGLITYNVTNPVYPESLNCWRNLGFHPSMITIVGDYAYVVEGNHIYIFTLADPSAPALLDSVAFRCSLTPHDGFLYGCHDRNFNVISLSNPTQPQIIGSCAMPFFWGALEKDIAFTGHYAYVAYYEGGVQIIDIANPEHPAVVGSIEGSYVTAIAANGNTLAFYQRPLNYLQAMIYIMDLSDPVHPQYVGHYSIIEEMSDMEIYGSYLLTVSPNKFAVYQVDALCGINTPEITPSEFALYPCYPNPFNSTLIIPFTLSIQTQATITIYNILGQKVRQFAFPPLSPGGHRVTWDAISCASGIYFVRMMAGDREFNRKVVLLK